jgi:crossover junction endodeoxyribonuclease RuvC
MGIDPGKSGSIVVLSGSRIYTISLKETERDIWEFIQVMSMPSGNVRAYLEKVSPMPKEGVSSVFKFGQSYGMLRGFLIASCIPFEWVTPATWCKAFGLKKSKNETKVEWKNKHKAKAQELFPKEKITHALADALLIAEYGRRKTS